MRSKSCPHVFAPWSGQAPRVIERPNRTEPGLVVAGYPEAAELNDVRVSASDRPAGQLVSWSSDAATGSVRVEWLSPELLELHCELEIRTRVSPSSICWRFAVTMSRPQYLSHRYLLQPLGRRGFVQSWTPFVLRSGDVKGPSIQIVAVDRPQAVSLVRSADGVECTAWLDHSGLHPRFWFDDDLGRHWHSEYTYEPGERLDVSFRVVKTEQPVPTAVVGRYPDGRRAAMSITDHADHDSYEKLAALLYGDSQRLADGPATGAGFAGLNLRFTKTIFPGMPPGQSAGLHDARFTEMCVRASEAGIEICPHGIHSTTQPAIADIPKLLEPFRRFRPRTWVDHGFRFSSNYAREGWDPDSPFSLYPHLDDLGIRYLWGFLDFGQAVPGGWLNQLDLSHFSGARYAADLGPLLARSIGGRQPWAVMHGVSVLMFQMVPDRAMQDYFAVQRHVQSVMRKRGLAALPPAGRSAFRLLWNVVQPASLASIGRQAVGPRDEFQMVPVLFAEHHSRRQATGRWLFNTVAVHDVVHSFRPASIDKLLEDYGLHIAHTYLGATSPAHLGHAMQPTACGNWRLADGFAENLAYIAQRHHEGQLWFAPIAEIGDFLAYQRGIRVIPEANRQWTVEFPGTSAGVEQRAVQLCLLGTSGQTTIRVQDQVEPLEPLHASTQMARINIRPGTRLRVECT